MMSDNLPVDPDEIVAICSVCGRPITGDSYLDDFEHFWHLLCYPYPLPLDVDGASDETEHDQDEW